jgi:hypothetical protein
VKTKTITIITATVACAVVAALTSTGTFSAISATAQQTAAVGTTVTFERTGMSSVDPCCPPTVVVLPPRTDGKLWVGTISWTASKPVELRLLYDYNSSLTTDAIHGKPVTGPLGQGEVAISVIKPFNGPATVSSFDSGSTNFLAKAVGFQTPNGSPFTITYAVDARAR